MEKAITKFSELGEPSGQLILINSVPGKDQVATFANHFKSEDGRETYAFLAEVGDYTFKGTDDPTTWNIRLIDETHPRYLPDMAKAGQQFNKLFDMFKAFDKTLAGNS